MIDEPKSFNPDPRRIRPPIPIPSRSVKSQTLQGFPLLTHGPHSGPSVKLARPTLGQISLSAETKHSPKAFGTIRPRPRRASSQLRWVR